MAESDGKEAITAVIEKLQEIVDKVKTRRGDPGSLNPGQAQVAEDGRQSATPKQNEEAVVILQREDGGDIETSSGESPDTGTSQIVLRLPSNLVPADKDALIRIVKSALENKESAGSQAVASSSGSKSTETAANKTMYKCAKCDYTSPHKRYLKQHVDLVHNADRPFKCPFCDFAGKRSHSLKEHMAVHGMNRPFECPWCNASFRKKGHLTSHVRMHSISSVEKLMECAYCQDRFYDKDLLYKHLRTSHNDKEVFLCEQCPFATTVQSSIEMHLHVHGGPQSCVCLLCDFVTTSSRLMEEHLASSHVGEPGAGYRIEERPVFMYKCSECGYTTNSKATLQDHMWTHVDRSTGSPPSAAAATQKAPSPETPVVSEQSLASATEDHTDNSNSSQPQTDVDNQPKTVYKCSDCSYVSSEASSFITHMLGHRSENVGESEQEVQPAAAPVHSESGTGSEQSIFEVGFTHDKSTGFFHCSICGYMCENQRSIKSHIWKHSGHKDIKYPMFQNGPISMYDDTPIGAVSIRPGAEGKESHLQAWLNQVGKFAEVPSTKPQSTRPLTVRELLEIKFKKGGVELDDIERSLASSVLQNAQVDVGNEVVISTNESGVLVATSVKTVTADSQKEMTLRNRPAILRKSSPPSLTVSTSITPASDIIRNIHTIKTQGSKSEITPSGKQSSEIGKLILKDKPKVNFHEAPAEVGSTPETECGEAMETEDAEKSTYKTKKSPPKRTCPDETEMHNAAKKLCTEETKRSGNVVVQPLSMMYLTPNISMSDSRVGSPQYTSPRTSRSNSPRIIDIRPRETTAHSPVNVQKSAEAHMPLSSNVAEADKADVPVSEAVHLSPAAKYVEVSSENDAHKSVESSEEVVTLLSLLQKGPNHNPACPSKQKPDLSDCDSAESTSGGSVDKPKSGICSSLLAVIEQLRERSKSECDDGDDGSESSKSRITRKSNKKSADSDEVDEIDQLDNVEKVEPDHFRCRLCHYMSTSTALIKTHMKMHKSRAQFDCSLCEYHAQSSEDLQEHMIKHCKVRTYQCKLCSSAVFYYKSQLRAHMRVHREKGMDCHMCNNADCSMCKDGLMCDLCGFETSRPATLQKHMKVHLDKKEFNCRGCSAAFTSKETLKQHTKDCTEMSKLIKSSSKLPRAPYQCIDKHSLMHKVALDQPQKCEFCDFIAGNIRSLKSHMKRHVNDQKFVQQPLEQYKCNLCGYVCHHLPSLKSHMWRHASDRNFCYESTNNIINAAIDYDFQLQRLRASGDMDEDPGAVSYARITKKQLEEGAAFVTFRCCQCGFETVNKAILNTHMKSHMDIIKKTVEANKGQIPKDLYRTGMQAVESCVEKYADESEASSKHLKASTPMPEILVNQATHDVQVEETAKPTADEKDDLGETCPEVIYVEEVVNTCEETGDSSSPHHSV